MNTIAYFDCYSGASGDMLLAALLDNTVKFDWFLQELKKLNLPDNSYDIEKTYVNRSSINTCKINISINNNDKTHRGYKSICKIIDQSSINNKAKELSKSIFYTIAKAEAKIHNKAIEEIHFHEIGALDSIIDVIGFSICYSSINIEKCYVSPLPVGSGRVKCAHGYMPVPAPATLEILKEHKTKLINIPEIKEECLTPTAAGILSIIANEFGSPDRIDNILNIGYGAGNKIFDKEITSNMRFILGESKLKNNNKSLFYSIEAMYKEKNLNTSGIINNSLFTTSFITRIFKENEELNILHIDCEEKHLPEIINKLKKSGKFNLIKYYNCMFTN